MRLNSVLGFSILSVVVVIGLPASAPAQGFISPFIGFFGDESNCPSDSTCDNKRINGGVAAGALGSVAGFEAELGYAKDFYGDSPGFDSNILTLMGNLVIAPKIGAVRPYGLVGVGLIRTKATLTVPNVLVSENNDFGWDVGGGLMVFFGDHVGIRGDIRRFQSLQDVEVLGFTLEDSKIKYIRASGALIFVF